MRSVLLGVLLAVGSALAWVWGYFSARAGHSASALSLWLGVVLVEAVIALPSIAFLRPYMGPLAIAAGVAGVAGYLLYFLALRAAPLGTAAPIVAVTAVYPVVTLVLGLVIDRVSPSPRQIVGMVLAMVAVLLIAI